MSTTRRHRGYQPAEVRHKAEARTEANPTNPHAARMPSISSRNQGSHAVESSKAETSKNNQPSKPTVSSDSKALTGTARKQASQSGTPPIPHFSQRPANSILNAPQKEGAPHTSNKNTSLSPVGLTPTVDTSTSKLDTASIAASVRSSSPSESSSISIVNDYPQKSCWTRALLTENPSPSQALATKPAWDNGTNPIDSPSWKRESVSQPGYCKSAVNANFLNLPPYKSPFKSPEVSSSKQKTKLDPASSSFSRQIANIKRSVQSTQGVSVRGGQPSGQAGVAKSELPMDGDMENPSSRAMPQNVSSTVTPHLRAQIIRSAANTREDDRGNEGQQSEKQAETLPPHLRKPVNRSKADAQGEINETTVGKITRVAQHIAQPHPDSFSTSASLVTARSGAKTPERKIDVDQELAATHCVVETENDAEIAATLAAEANDNDELIAATLQEEVSGNKSLGPHRETQNREARDLLHTVPPHLRKSKPTTINPKTHLQYPGGEHSTSAHQDDRNFTTVTSFGNPEDVAQTPWIVGMGSPTGGVSLATEIKTIEWSAKTPASGRDRDNSPSNLVGWDGKLAPALLGEDWANRSQVSRKDHHRLEAIKTWTEDSATSLHNGIAVDQDNQSSPICAQHPETLPNPDEFNQAKRHLSATHHIQAFKAKRSTSGKSLSGSERRLTRDERRNQRRTQKDLINSQEIPPNEHAPTANIYLRPAEMKDMRQVMLLHNHYVLKSAYANDLEENDEIYWRNRLQECHDEVDPFLVAIHKDQKAAKNTRDAYRKKSETVVGFAFATDYGLQRTAFRFTVELELWVHHAYLHQGIGRSMLDRILAALDPGYNVLECAPVGGKYDPLQWNGGGHCIVKTILVNLLYSQAGEEELEWKKKWLSDNNFEHQGTLTDLGFKFGKP